MSQIVFEIVSREGTSTAVETEQKAYKEETGAKEEISQPGEISFTALYPKEGKVEDWHTLLVYIHLQSALEEIRRDARRFQDQIPMPKEVTTFATTSIVRGTEITVIPSGDGMEFNPERLVVKWMENYHRTDFRFRADASLVNDAARGQINFYVGPILVGTLKVALLINEEETLRVLDLEEHGNMYRQEDIFISYSHLDTAVVLEYKKAIDALGFDSLIDRETLRAGQVWSEELMHMIDRASIFQLFWSQNSSQSDYCRQEWEHVVKCSKDKVRYCR